MTLREKISDYSRRIFIINGYTRDSIVADDAVSYQFDFFLNKYCREELNYERVINVDTDGVYFLDRESIYKALDLDRSNGEDETLAGLLPREGPGGGFTTMSVPKGEATDDYKWRYYEWDTIDRLYNNLKDWICEEIPTAIIVYDDELLESDSKLYRKFLGSLRTTFHRLDPENKNIIIFTYRNLDAESLEQKWGRDIINDNTAGLAEYIEVGLPGKDEIRNLVHRERIKREKQVDWENIDKIINKLYASVRKRDKRLKSLALELKRYERIDSGLLEEMGIYIEELSARERFAELVGMADLKEKIYEFVRGSRGLKRKRNSGTTILTDRFVSRKITGSREMMHLALLGNPGTGKSTVAGLIGEIMQEEGLLESGHTITVSRDGLVAGYAGQTAIKTRRQIDRAIGGVLFIDEAYSLVRSDNDEFGQEALDTLVEAMTARAGEFIVIMAGYRNEMNQLLGQNPGLSRRIKRIEIPDYNEEELAEIFKIMVGRRGVKLSASVEERVLNFTTALLRNREKHGGDHFGNAGVIEEIIQQALHRARIRSGEECPTLLKEDFPDGVQAYFSGAVNNKTPEEELEDLVGLDSVKNVIRNYQYRIRHERDRGKTVSPGHFAFLGNPGTGKSTVARLLANIFYELDLLSTNRFIERSASDLMGSVVGETENKFREILNNALGGLLFIDEAHQLYSARERDRSFGKEVIKVMVPFMENHRREFCLVLAGYPREMREMMMADPGLRGRIGNIIEFEDYTPSELVEIFRLFVKEDGSKLETDCEQLLREEFKSRKRELGNEFDNARMVRRFLEGLKTVVSRRYLREKEEGLDPDPDLIKECDLKECIDSAGNY